MELLIDCIPCLLRQSLEAARIATDQKEIHNKIMKDTIQLLTEYDKYENPPSWQRKFIIWLKTRLAILIHISR